jgi:hypothetical protein
MTLKEKRKMIKSGNEKALWYAFEKTEMMLDSNAISDDNLKSLPIEDIHEWNEAIDEYYKKEKQ